MFLWNNEALRSQYYLLVIVSDVFVWLKTNNSLIPEMSELWDRFWIKILFCHFIFIYTN